MTYIILAAGKGANLRPLTLKYPKTSFRILDNTTVLQRLVRSIRFYDRDAEIVVVTGYLGKDIRRELGNDSVKFVHNPFYEVTNSIASLWFARDYLERENVTVIHGDVVFSDTLTENYITKPTDYPYVFIDTSYMKPGVYNVVTKDGRVLVMSRQLEEFSAKYGCLTKLDAVTARLLKKEINLMIDSDMYDQFFEDALVQMIMFSDLHLKYVDIAGNRWREVDSVDDLLTAREIVSEERSDR